MFVNGMTDSNKPSLKSYKSWCICAWTSCPNLSRKESHWTHLPRYPTNQLCTLRVQTRKQDSPERWKSTRCSKWTSSSQHCRNELHRSGWPQRSTNLSHSVSTKPNWTALPSKVLIESLGWTNVSIYFASLEYSWHSMATQAVGKF